MNCAGWQLKPYCATGCYLWAADEEYGATLAGIEKALRCDERSKGWKHAAAATAIPDHPKRSCAGQALLVHPIAMAYEWLVRWRPTSKLSLASVKHLAVDSQQHCLVS